MWCGMVGGACGADGVGAGVCGAGACGADGVGAGVCGAGDAVGVDGGDDAGDASNPRRCIVGVFYYG